MVDNETATKVEENETPEVESEETLSLESLDSIIADADPEFAQSLTEIGPDESGGIEIYNEGLDLEYTLEAETKRWKEAQGFQRKLIIVFPFLPKISYKFKIKRTLYRLSWIKFKEQAVYRLKNAVPLLLAWLKSQAVKVKIFIHEGLDAFRAFSLFKKIALAGLIIVTGAAGYLLFRLSKGPLIPKSEFFVASMSDWAHEKYLYDPETQVEPFYDSTRTSQNILLLKKMIVNLRRSSESGPTPMGAFEFYVEGSASEVVVEVKDREPEVYDLFARTIEEMTFDQISSGEGKKLLCDRLRHEMNKILTKGLVRRVFIKTAIVKP